MKSGERKIDLLIYFDINLKTSLKRSQERDNRKFTKQEKETFKKFNDKLKDFIRYNNSEYSLLVIENNDTLAKTKEQVDLLIEFIKSI